MVDRELREPSRKFSLDMEAVEEGAEVLTYQN